MLSTSWPTPLHAGPAASVDWPVSSAGASSDDDSADDSAGASSADGVEPAGHDVPLRLHMNCLLQPAAANTSARHITIRMILRPGEPADVASRANCVKSPGRPLMDGAAVQRRVDAIAQRVGLADRQRAVERAQDDPDQHV